MNGRLVMNVSFVYSQFLDKLGQRGPDSVPIKRLFVDFL